MTDALDVACPVCGAEPGAECDQPLTHVERRDAVGDPGPWIAADLDNDGVAAWEDIDDPAHWL